MAINRVKRAVGSVMLTPSVPNGREELPRVDVRIQLDDAARRGWAIIARRVVRLAVLIISDSLACLMAGITIGAFLPVWGSGPASSTQSWYSILSMSLVVQPLALGVLGAYAPGLGRIRYGRVFLGVALAAAIIWVQTSLMIGKGAEAPTFNFVGYIALAALLCSLGRISIDTVITAVYRSGIGVRRVLVVGTRDEAARVAESLKHRRASDFRVMGFLSAGLEAEPGSYGTLAKLDSALRTSRADGIIVSSNLTPDAFETLVRHCFRHGAEVFAVPRTLDRIRSTIELTRTRAGTLLALYPHGLRLPQLAIKRALDVAASVLLVVMLAPLLVLITVAIKLDTNGPILFSQLRAGVGARPFRMLKFRTMFADADRMKRELQHLNESGDPRLFKIRNDPRVTRVGRWLRRTSLDELPQLLNVLRGEMSLVGPRPFFPDDILNYEPHHFERLTVLPGITGLWQVSGRSDIVDFEEVVRLDGAYIRNWSIGRDLWILLRTIPAAFGRGGAY